MELCGTPPGSVGDEGVASSWLPGTGKDGGDFKPLDEGSPATRATAGAEDADRLADSLLTTVTPASGWRVHGGGVTRGYFVQVRWHGPGAWHAAKAQQARLLNWPRD
jgi:hypothetical protein